MLSMCSGRFPVQSLFVSLFILAAGSALFGGETKNLTLDDGKKLPTGKTRPPFKLHADDAVVVRLDQNPGLGFHWVESPDSTKLLELKDKKTAANPASNPNGVGGSVETLILTYRFKANAAPTDQPQYLRINKLEPGNPKKAKVIDTFEVPFQVVK
jgi:hypothetical protein